MTSGNRIKSMKLLPIVPGLAARIDVKQPDETQAAELRKKHGYRCAYCSFLALGALKMTYYEPQKRWAPACPLCFDSLYLDMAENIRPSAKMVALSNVSQAKINIVTHYHWLCESSQGEEYAEAIKGTTQVLSKFEFGTRAMRNVFGKDADNLELFVGVLENLPVPRYRRRENTLSTVRYFNREAGDYKAFVDYWKEHSYPRLRKQVLAAINEVS